MQFYLNGYRPGDPKIHEAAPNAMTPGEDLPDEVDVLIVGTGPAGLIMSAQLAQFPEITTRIVERRQGPLQLGQADGVACRTVEMFDAFGLAENLVKEAYWVNETTFWGPSAEDSGKIARTGHIQDVADGLSEYPHVIVNQARMQQFLLDHMLDSPTRLEPNYGLYATGVEVADSGDYPVTVTLQPVGPDMEYLGDPRTVRAKYVVGADGARSPIRQSLGIEMIGDARNHAWGVMDMLAVTDFPDIRFKAAIQSGSGGSILLIPREGGYLVRLYVDMGDIDPDPKARKMFNSDDIIAAAQKILHPYTLDVRDIAWWSVYEVGQRIAQRFDDVPDAERGGDRIPRVFIAGDACHTHSAKAGQGMNVSMQDTFNLGWKLASVLRGRSKPELLQTYHDERRDIAQELIDFDLKWSTAMAAKPKDPNDPNSTGMDPGERQSIFTQGGRFTAGFATDYRPSLIVGHETHEHLATGFPIGERFHSAPVVRLADGKPVQIGHEASADARWRIYLFADPVDPADPQSRLSRLCRALEEADSPLRRFTPEGADPDAVFDVKAIFQQGHRVLPIENVPELLFPRKGPFGLKDYEKAFCPDLKDGPDIFNVRGINRQQGAMVVVRPDQYVAHVLPLDGEAELGEFFAGFMVEG